MKTEFLKKFKETRLFFGQAMFRYRDMGMLFPSSQHVADKIADLLPIKNMKAIVEIGSGTGSLTRAILRKMNSEARLICIEKTTEFCRYLEDTIRDPRLTVIESAAEDVLELNPKIAASGADCVVLSLPAKLVSPQIRQEWADLAWTLLNPNGILAVQQCVPAMKAHLQYPKWSPHSRNWIFNIPPFWADIFTRHE